jgi:prepilin-type N-terminal cleavage/methylation domain-containing protein
VAGSYLSSKFIGSSKGFSLLELIVVVAIIGILSAIGIPTYQGYMQKGRDTDAQMALRSISAAQERFKLVYGVYCGSSSTPICNSHETIVTNLLSSVNINTKYYNFSVTSDGAVGFVARADSITDASYFFSIDNTDCLRQSATSGTNNCL